MWRDRLRECRCHADVTGFRRSRRLQQELSELLRPVRHREHREGDRRPQDGTLRPGVGPAAVPCERWETQPEEPAARQPTEVRPVVDPRHDHARKDEYGDRKRRCEPAGAQHAAVGGRRDEAPWSRSRPASPQIPPEAPTQYWSIPERPNDEAAIQANPATAALIAKVAHTTSRPWVRSARRPTSASAAALTSSCREFRCSSPVVRYRQQSPGPPRPGIVAFGSAPNAT